MNSIRNGLGMRETRRSRGTQADRGIRISMRFSPKFITRSRAGREPRGSGSLRPGSRTSLVRYTTCRLYRRRELVGDVYFGSAVFGATYCDLLNELFDQFAPSMPRLVCVLFECLQAAAQGREPRGRVLCRRGVLLFSGEASLGRLDQHLQVRDTVLDVQKVNLQLFLV